MSQIGELVFRRTCFTGVQLKEARSLPAGHQIPRDVSRRSQRIREPLQQHEHTVSSCQRVLKRPFQYPFKLFFFTPRL